jgi:hypothetical protein
MLGMFLNLGREVRQRSTPPQSPVTRRQEAADRPDRSVAFFVLVLVLVVSVMLVVAYPDLGSPNVRTLGRAGFKRSPESSETQGEPGPGPGLDLQFPNTPSKARPGIDPRFITIPSEVGLGPRATTPKRPFSLGRLIRMIF